MMIHLYRTISTAERNDFNTDKHFRTSRNTLEGKQFFKSHEGLIEYIKDTQLRGYYPEYTYWLDVNIDTECLEAVPYEEQELDRFKVITIHEDFLPQFNKCVNFVEEYAI